MPQSLQARAYHLAVSAPYNNPTHPCIAPNPTSPAASNDEQSQQPRWEEMRKHVCLSGQMVALEGVLGDEMATYQDQRHR